MRKKKETKANKAIEQGNETERERERELEHSGGLASYSGNKKEEKKSYPLHVTPATLYIL